MRVIWLAGWYPTTQNAFSGNFVRRHYHAVKNAAAANDEFELYHFAPYESRDKIPALLEGEDTSVNIVPVRQFSGPFRILNALIYYFIVFRKLGPILFRSADLVHVHAADKIGVAVAFLKIFGSYKLWLTEHWAIFKQDVPDAFEKRGWWFQFSYRYLWNRVDSVLAISKELHSAMCEVLQKEIEYSGLENSLDAEFVPYVSQQKSNNNIDPETLNILHVSNGESRKNVAQLVKAFQEFKLQCPGANLTLIGSEGHHRYLDVVGVATMPAITTSELAKYYMEADLLVLVSDAENAPCVIVEALCFGVPVLVTTVGGIGGMCNSQNSIQIPPFQTHEEKAEKIHRALLDFLTKNQTFDSMQIQQNALKKYHPDAVGRAMRFAYENQ